MKPVSAAPDVTFITPAELKSWLDDAAEIALLDVREHGQYGESHLFFGVNVPYSRLECDIGRLVPRLQARIVLYDEGDGVAERAAAALAGLGYTDVACLAGGVAAWKAAGYNLFAGVNLPSKTFGELAEHVFATPRIGARELAERIARRDDLVVLDGRPFTEYRKMNIPGSTCCPNGELALRARELAPDPQTTIVINCAGRTRSIIGAQTLINLGVPNPVYALENGTQGWYLEDLDLEHGAERRHGLDLPAEDLDEVRQRAWKLADRAGVRTVAAGQLAQWLDDAARTTYLCDVRTPEEFAQGSLPGAQHTPGGQLIQATDQYVGVQRARLVLCDAEGVRAPVVASWLAQMGWEVYVLEEGVQTRLSPSRQPRPQPPAVAAIDTAGLAEAMRGGAQLVDVRPSMQYRQVHLDGAQWSIRPRLAGLPLQAGKPVVVVAAHAGVGALAVRTLAQAGVADARLHVGTPQAWRDAGLPLRSGDDQPADADCIDYLFFVHDRHDGNKEAARQYLAWETNLVNQIDDQERARFRFPLAGSSH